MGNGDATRSHRIAERFKTSTGGERAWGVWQAVVVAGILGLAATAFAMRDDLIKATAFVKETAPAVHEDHDKRLNYLERPEALLQLAQATDAVAEVKAAAKLATENAASIRVIESELGHLKDGQTQAQKDRDRMLRILDNLNVRQPQ